ncbi:hypothetical protein [Candidatus Enterococcus ferrettii]|nr:hypothetical protein [Enterococcus sp. 665A]
MKQPTESFLKQMIVSAGMSICLVLINNPRYDGHATNVRDYIGLNNLNVT